MHHLAVSTRQTIERPGQGSGDNVPSFPWLQREDAAATTTRPLAQTGTVQDCFAPAGEPVAPGIWNPPAWQLGPPAPSVANAPADGAPQRIVSAAVAADPSPIDADILARVQAAVGDPAAVDDPARRATMQQRFDLLIAAYTAAGADGDPGLQAQANALAGLYHDREVLALTRALGTSDEPRDQPPAGWHEATAEELALYGLTTEDLRSDPSGRGFNAELYVPDPDVFGPGAVPVLVFEGTDFGDPGDVHSDVAQALGHEDAYYNRAMEMALRVSEASGGRVEFAGHSLGGGLASAAALVTGGRAIVSNPAGVHSATLGRFLDQRGLAPPAAGDSGITTYVVEGDLLTGLQAATAGLSPDHADSLATIFNGILRAYNQATGARLPTDANGGDLRALPDASGEVVTLPAVDADGAPRPGMLTMAEILERIQGTADTLSLPGRVVDGGGGILGGILGGIGDAFDWVLDQGGSLLRDAGGFLGWADRYLPGDVAGRFGDGLSALGDGFDDFGDILERGADAAAQIARATGRALADVQRDIAVAVAVLVEALGATEVQWRQLPGGGPPIPVPTGNEILASVSEGVQRHSAGVLYEAMDARIAVQESALRAALG